MTTLFRWNPLTRARWLTVAVLAGVAAVCFVGLGRLPLYETDEGFAANRADSMLRHGTWLLSYDDVGETGPQYHKPPLLYWCVAGLLRTLGHNTWSVRLPTAIASFAAILLTWRLARRHVDDRVALLGAALLAAVPFAVLHMRTAMLEMPLLALLLAGTWSFAYARSAATRVFATGLAGAAAILIKGNVGAYVTVVPLLYGLALRRFAPRALFEALLVPLVAFLPPVLYFGLIPEPFRSELATRLFVKEATERVRDVSHVDRQLARAAQDLIVPLGACLVAALLGFVAASVDAVRRRAFPAWLLLTLLVAIPPLAVYATMVRPFPRYLLPLYPPLLVLAVQFFRQATATRAAAGWLAPYAVATLALAALHRDPWLLLPAAAALLVLGAVCCRAAPFGRPVAFATLLLSLATATACSPTTRTYLPRAEHHPRPALVPLARRIDAEAPPDARILCQDRMKCHTLLFYGRRGIDPLSDWLLTLAAPGDARFGIFPQPPPLDLPGVETVPLAQSGPWHLARLRIAAPPDAWHGLLLGAPEAWPALAATLDLLDVRCQPCPGGFQLTALPPSASAIPFPPAAVAFVPGPAVNRVAVPGAVWRLETGDALRIALPPDATPCLGLELHPLSKLEPMSGLRIEHRTGPDAAWRPLKAVESTFDPTLELVDGRLRRTVSRRLRLRWEAVAGGELQLWRTGQQPLNLKELWGYVPAPASSLGSTRIGDRVQRPGSRVTGG